MKSVAEFRDFEFDGRRLSEFGGVLVDKDLIFRENIAPSVDVKTNPSPTGDGLDIVSVSYGVRYICLTALLEDYSNLKYDYDSLKEWLYSKEPKKFKYVGDDKYINGVFTGEIDLEILNGNNALLELELTCHDPKWNLDEVPIVLTKVFTNERHAIINNGTVESYPIICIEGHGDIQIEINNITYSIDNVIDNVYIRVPFWDVNIIEEGNFKPFIANYRCENGKHRWDMPMFKLGENTFILRQGTINRITFTLNQKAI